MTDQAMPALRRRFLDDMRIKGLLPKTQTMYLRAMREFTRFLGHSPGLWGCDWLFPGLGQAA